MVTKAFPRASGDALDEFLSVERQSALHDAARRHQQVAAAARRVAAHIEWLAAFSDRQAERAAVEAAWLRTATAERTSRRTAGRQAG